MSNTTNLDLERPDKGDTEWHTSLNSNMTKLDAGYGNNVASIADLPEVYIETGTFNSTTGDVITLPKSVDAISEYNVTVTPTSGTGGDLGFIYVSKAVDDFTVYCTGANTTDTYSATIYYIGDIASYGGSIYRRWYVSPDATITDHGDDTDTGSLAWVLDQIGATSATVELPGNKTYTITTDTDIPNNVIVVLQNGAVWDGAGTLSFVNPGQIHASPTQQIFGSSITVVFTEGGTVYPDWFKKNAAPGTTDMGVAITSAITSLETAIGGEVAFNGVDYYTTTQIDYKNWASWRGMGTWIKSRIVVATGAKIYFETTTTTRYASVTNMQFYTADTSLDLVHLDSVAVLRFTECYFSGGGKSVRIDEAINVDFTRCMFANDAAFRYAIHVDSATFVNSLRLSKCRIDGMSFFDCGPSGRQLELNSIFESENDPVVNINRVYGFQASNSYFESAAGADTLLDIDANVESGLVSGCFFGVHVNTDVHVLCDGKAINFIGNYFGTIGAQDLITLEANSQYCFIGHQWDGSSVPAVPKVTDNGTQNKVWGWHSKHYWIGASELMSSTGSPELKSAGGAPYLELTDTAEETIDYLFRLPDDRWTTVSVSFDVVYRFNASQGAVNARLVRSAKGQATGEIIQTVGVISTDLIAPTNLNVRKLNGGNSLSVATSDEFVLFELERTALHVDDDTTSHLFIYGIDIIVTKTLGY